MTNTPAALPVKRWHMEVGENMVAGQPLYKGQQEYVLASDYAALESRLKEALDMLDGFAYGSGAMASQEHQYRIAALREGLTP